MKALVPEAPFPLIKKAVTFSRNLLEENEFKQIPFSLRQLIRSLKLASSVMKRFPETGNLLHFISESMLAKFLPVSTKAILFSILKRSGIEKEAEVKDESLSPIIAAFGKDDVEGEKKGKGGSNVKEKDSEKEKEEHLIPKILFFENDRQRAILNEMNLAFSRGEPLLLIGNQGTGAPRLNWVYFPCSSC